MSMATLLSLDLPETPINTALDAIIARARTATDRNGNRLFSAFDRAADVVAELANASGDAPIVGRIWHDSLSMQSKTVQLFEVYVETVVSIYVLFHLPADDIYQRGFQEQRERFCRHFLNQLEHPDDGSDDGIEPDANWRFGPVNEIAVAFDIDHTAPFKRFGTYKTVEPPKYISRIDFKITVLDTERT